MTEPPQPPTGRIAGRESRLAADSARPATTRVAVASSGFELPLAWVRGATLMLILGGGFTLYAARSALAPALDRWLPVQSGTAAEPPPELAETVPEPAPSELEPEEPEWVYVDVEAALTPLPESTERLIAEGREELTQFRGLGSADETRALPARNRWQLWGRIWHNRLDHVRNRMPPLEVCAIHVVLEPTCRALDASFEILERVPAAERVEDASGLFDEASGVLAEWAASQPESDAP